MPHHTEEKMRKSYDKAERKIKIIKSLYVIIPLLFIFTIYFFGDNVYTFNIYKVATLFIFGVVWVLWVSFGSIIINRYVFIDVPVYDINDNSIKAKKKRNHPWFKMPMHLQLIDLVSNLSLIIVFFVILQFIFKKIFLKGNVEQSNVSSHFIRFMTRIYLFITTGKFGLCNNRTKEQCINTYYCKYRNNECITRNSEQLVDYSIYVSKNINILNAFLTVYFQTNIQNKLKYFIKTYLSDKDKLLFVPHFGN